MQSHCARLVLDVFLEKGYLFSAIIKAHIKNIQMDYYDALTDKPVFLYFTQPPLFQQREAFQWEEHVPQGRGADPEIICFFK